MFSFDESENSDLHYCGLVEEIEENVLAGERGDREGVHDQAAHARGRGIGGQRDAVVAGGVGQHPLVAEALGGGDRDGVQPILDDGTDLPSRGE